MKMPEVISFLFHDHSILRRHPTVGLELPVPPLKLWDVQTVPFESS